MNFSHKGIQNRKHQLESAATHRLHKLQLMGIRLTLIGLIFVGLFAGSFLIAYDPTGGQWNSLRG